MDQPTTSNLPNQSNEPTDQPTNKPADQPTDQPTDQPAQSVQSTTSGNAFEARLNHLVLSGAFNEDNPRRAKGLRQHIKMCLKPWELERRNRIYRKAPTSIAALKWSLKNKGM